MHFQISCTSHFLFFCLVMSSIFLGLTPMYWNRVDIGYTKAAYKKVPRSPWLRMITTLMQCCVAYSLPCKLQLEYIISLTVWNSLVAISSNHGFGKTKLSQRLAHTSFALFNYLRHTTPIYISYTQDKLLIILLRFLLVYYTDLSCMNI